MKWQNILTNLFSSLLTTVGLTGLGLVGTPALAQANPAAPLNAELSQAVCQQDWARAIRVVDRMRAVAPADRRGELTVYRGRLHALLNSGTPIPNWQCGAGGTTVSTTLPITTAPSSPAMTTNANPTSNPAISPSPNSATSTEIRGVRRDPNSSGSNNSSNGTSSATGGSALIDRARNLNQTINNP